VVFLAPNLVLILILSRGNWLWIRSWFNKVCIRHNHGRSCCRH